MCVPLTRACAVCGSTGSAHLSRWLSSCGRCLKVHYCCAEHQRAHWAEHKLVCQPVDTDGHTPIGREFLACDAVQAGPGDLVLAAREGNTARQILGTATDPHHAVVLGVVDMLDVQESR